MPRNDRKNKRQHSKLYQIQKQQKAQTKKEITQTGYNEQIVVDNKNGLYNSSKHSTDGNDSKTTNAHD